MPVIIYPKNSCETRAPPDPPRPRERAKSHPHSSLRDPRQKFAAIIKSLTRVTKSYLLALGTANSASDDFSKLPASNHYISFWLSGRTLDSGQAERQFKPPCLRFFAFVCIFSAVVREFNSLCLRFIFILTYYCKYEYCCFTVVHTWWVRGLLVVDEFFCCVLCFTAVPCTTYCCTAVIQDWWVGEWIGSWVSMSWWGW